MAPGAFRDTSTGASVGTSFGLRSPGASAAGPLARSVADFVGSRLWERGSCAEDPQSIRLQEPCVQAARAEDPKQFGQESGTKGDLISTVITSAQHISTQHGAFHTITALHSTAPDMAHQHRYFEHCSFLSPKSVVMDTLPCSHVYIPFRVRESIIGK